MEFLIYIVIGFFIGTNFRVLPNEPLAVQSLEMEGDCIDRLEGLENIRLTSNSKSHDRSCKTD